MGKDKDNLSKYVMKDSAEVLEKAIDGINAKNVVLLRDLSNNTIHNASIFQDKYSVLIAVVMYALSKIIERDEIKSIVEDLVYKINEAKECAEENNKKCLDSALKKIIRIISRKDKVINKYIQHVINEAEIKKGSRIYEHGISLAQTAEILGISQWELMIYIGHTNIAEESTEKTSIRKRLEYARKIFGIR